MLPPYYWWSFHWQPFWAGTSMSLIFWPILCQLDTSVLRVAVAELMAITNQPLMELVSEPWGGGGGPGVASCMSGDGWRRARASTVTQEWNRVGEESGTGEGVDRTGQLQGWGGGWIKPRKGQVWQWQCTLNSDPFWSLIRLLRSMWTFANDQAGTGQRWPMEGQGAGLALGRCDWFHHIRSPLSRHLPEHQTDSYVYPELLYKLKGNWKWKVFQ